MERVSDARRPKRYSLAIELTPYCNQKCGYCYNDWRDQPSTQPSVRGDQLVALVDKATREVELDHVTLTGGEPFARPELFDVLELLRGKGLRALIISNGGLITADHARRLAPYDPLFVQVTLNGPDRALHEEHVGEGHYDATLAGIRALSEAGVTVAGCIVITRKNASKVGAILELWASLGVRSVALSRFSPAGYAAENAAELLPSRSELMEALTQAESLSTRLGLTLQVTMPVPPCVIDPADYPHLRFSSCPIGTEMQEFALGPSGELRHCTLHTESLGNGHERSFAAMVTSEPVRRYRDTSPAFCEPCPMKAECGGGCGAAAAAISGDPRGLDPIVAQHVEPTLEAELDQARTGGAFIPARRLARRRRLEREREAQPEGLETR